MKMSGRVLRHLHALWVERGGNDAYLGTLVNAWLERGGRVVGVRGGEAYVDVGTLHGYREASALLETRAPSPAGGAPHLAPPSPPVLSAWPAVRAPLRGTNDDDEPGTGTGETPL
jgi:hypothetical protein